MYKQLDELKQRPEFYVNDLEANIRKDIFRHLPKESQQKIIEIKKNMGSIIEELGKKKIPKDLAIQNLSKLSSEAHKLFYLPKKARISSAELPSLAPDNIRDDYAKLESYRTAEKNKIIEEEQNRNKPVPDKLAEVFSVISDGVFAAVTGPPRPTAKKEHGVNIIALRQTVDKKRNKVYYEFPDSGPAKGMPLEKRLVVASLNVSYDELEKKIKEMLNGAGINPTNIQISGTWQKGSSPPISVYYRY